MLRIANSPSILPLFPLQFLLFSRKSYGRIKISSYLCRAIRKESTILLEYTKRYARLANGNVRNFYKMQV